MGGIGSGRRFQHRGPHLEEVPQLDVRALKRGGLFDQITSNGSIKWTNPGLPEAALEYAYADSTLCITYAVKALHTASNVVSQRIFIDRTTCNYGGTRTWFLCPSCGARKAILYCASKWFLCRQCYGLNYTCQNEVYADRMIRKARKLRAKLGASMDLQMPISERPHGMYRSTFERLIRQDQANIKNVVGAYSQRLLSKPN
ncbi:MAG: hypothetical protein HOI09_09265 [Porticoccaceae bacterium]|jgi:hypothetical protein|nr:hypothetical protein [Porticoccaceae bacterium]